LRIFCPFCSYISLVLLVSVKMFEEHANLVLSVLLSLPIMLAITGFALHRHPEFLHKRKATGKLALKSLIGHRGSRDEGLPENSVAAFIDAARTAHIVELDVWLTKDEKVIVHHDDTFRRMTQGQSAAPVTELHYHECPHIVPGGRQTRRVHEFEHEHCHCVPTLEQILTALPPDIHLIIEFKQDSDLLIRKVHALLTKFDRVRDKRDYWFSLVDTINNKLHAFDPHIPLIVSVLGMLRILALYHVGLLPFWDIKESAYCVPVATVRFPWLLLVLLFTYCMTCVCLCVLSQVSMNMLKREKALKGIPTWGLYILRALCVGSPPLIFVQRSLFTHLRSRGIAVMFLGVNSERHLTLAADTGATAVLTDKIHQVHRHVGSKGLKFRTVKL
jgi:glycerophosphoryl diester phosphodiesterase